MSEKIAEKTVEKKVILNQYEAMFLLATSFAAELENAQKLVSGIVERHGGQVIVLKKWDERKLAYELEGQKRGLYLLCYFKAPGSAVTAMERDVNLSDKVLRVMITKADHLNPEEMAAVEPQPIQPREERNPWDRPQFDDRGPRSDRPRDDRPRDDRPRDDRPREDRPARAPRGVDAEAAVGKDR
jgi:small subunit ribosomal protein S6